MEWEITKCFKIFANDIIRDVYAQNPEFFFCIFRHSKIYSVVGFGLRHTHTHTQKQERVVI